MEWVKQRTDYYLKAPVAMGDDAMEVMLERGRALAGQLEQHGFIPDSLLHHLTRKPAQARKTAQALVDGDLWERVPGGYLIVGWAEDQEALEKEVARKERDAARKRTKRAQSRASGDESADADADSPGDGPSDSSRASDSEEDLDTAAAASSDELADETDLPGELVILRARLDAANLAVRWDKLSRAQVTEMVALQHRFGDNLLVEIAKKSWRADSPPQYAQAWLGNWAKHARAASSRDALPSADPCKEPGHSGTTHHCAQCAAERLELEGAGR